MNKPVLYFNPEKLAKQKEVITSQGDLIKNYEVGDKVHAPSAPHGPLKGYQIGFSVWMTRLGYQIGLSDWIV